MFSEKIPKMAWVVKMNLSSSQYILYVSAQILLDFVIGSNGFVSMIAI